MAASENGKKYVVGKGRLYFGAFTAGTKASTGQRYLGNSPELTSNQSQDTLDHIDADQGLNVKDEQLTISNDLGGSFALDSIDMANVALWFGGDLEKATVAAAAAVAEPDFRMTPGTWHHLGKTADNPQGTRSIDNVSVVVVTAGVPGTALDATALAANFEFDLEMGRMYMEPTSTLLDTDTKTLRVTYDQEAITNEIVIGKGQEIRGELYFQAKNPKGENKDYYWPYVKLTANGDYALKGDSWQQMSFNYEVLKLNDATERVYITNRPATA